MDIIIFSIITLISGAIQGITGMGYSMICMSILTFLFPYKDMAMCLKILTVIYSSTILFKSRKHIRFKILIVPLITTFIGTGIGFVIFSNFSEEFLKKMLGLLLLTVSVFFILNKKEIVIKPTVRNGSITGIITGIFSGACNVPGPPLAIYYLNTIKDDKEAYYATMTAHFLISGIFQLITFGFSGEITNPVINLTFIGLIPTVCGYAFGRKIFSKINSRIIVKCVYIMMGIMGSILFIK